MGALKQCWLLGLPVPYPVQIIGTELLMEWITHDGDTAPRLAQTRPSPALLGEYFAQLREAMATMAQHGIVHGDLSAYNILAAGERLVIIDLPQVTDVIGNPNGMDFLMRDCANVCAWFRSRGLDPATRRRARPLRRPALDGVLSCIVEDDCVVESRLRPPKRLRLSRL